MRTHMLRGLLATASGMVLIASTASAAEIKWSKTFDSALAAAKTSHKLVMADFYTDW